MKNRPLLLAFLASLLLLSPAFAQTEIRWYVGLGAGTDEPTIAAQQALVDQFNATHDDIELKLEIVDNDNAYDVLATQIAAGNAPDLVGPMGVRGRASFPGVWLDLAPLIEKYHYDLSDLDPALVDFYRIEGVGQLGIPFAVYPSYLSYNKDLFDEAGLPYPPHQYGAPYLDENGVKHPWNIETMSELAMKLTVDANGNDATSADFDPDNIVQWGYGEQYTDLRGRATLFGAANFVDAEGNAVIPDAWRKAIHWMQDAMWTRYFSPSGPYANSALLEQGNWFDSGNLAMAHTHLWYQACCLTSLSADWDIAAMPANAQGVATAKLHGDTFGILKSSAHPDAAFEVLSYLLSPEVEGELAAIYGGMPARLELQDDYLASLSEEKFPDLDIDWQVAIDSLSHPDNPNHEEGMPGFREATDRYNAFTQRLDNEPDLDVDAELDALRDDLQVIFDAARERAGN